MISDADLADMRVDFANDRFDLTHAAVQQLAERGLTIDGLVGAVCDRSSYVAASSNHEDRHKGEHGTLLCPAANPSLLVSLWYIRAAPRSILIDEVS